MMLNNEARKGERGNVLFLILIAVALFAALSYAVTQSTRSGGGDASSEGNLVNSAQITQYPASVRTSIVRMVIGGADVETLEFNPPEDFGNCTTIAGEAARCVFHPDGGGATHSQAPGDVMASGSPGNWSFNGENEIYFIGTSNDGASTTASTADLIAFLVGVSNGICSKINDELGINGIPAESGIEYSSATMVNPNGSTDSTIGGGGGVIGADPDNGLNAQPFGCFNDGTDNVYYHVLIER